MHTAQPSGPRRLVRIAAIAAATVVLAAGCGSSKKDSGATATTLGGGGGTTAPGPTTTLVPKDGGDITMGTEADIDGFDPTRNRWDITGLTYAQTVYDELAQFGDDGKVYPYLAESITPNATFTEWTIKLRPGIKFHDGSPVTNVDVATALQADHDAPLTGTALANVDTITKVAGDNLSTLVKMKRPWVPFPGYLTGQLGVVPKAATITGKTAAQKPVGTGPFVFKEWVVGNHFTATKNPNYWRKGLPHLNSITFKPIVEPSVRESALKAGDIQIFHTTETHTIKNLKGDKSVNTILQTKGELEEDMIMLNTGKEPFNNAHARKAVALATDVEAIIQDQADGIPPKAEGPFSSGSAWDPGNVGYPQFNVDDAKKEVAAYKVDTGKDLTFALSGVPGARSVELIQYQLAQWKTAGIIATFDQTEQSQYILNALQGKYQAIGWRQFGEPDPDFDNVWWNSVGAADQGALALNFARNKDPLLDAAMLKGRESSILEERKAAYKDVATRLAIDLPFIFTTQATWAIMANPKIHDITNWTLPDGTKGAELLSGRFQIAQVWTE